MTPCDHNEAVVKPDMVNHPPHYKTGTLEVIDAIDGLGLNDEFCLANAVKYICRSRHKGTEIQDLKKAIWYISHRIKKLERGTKAV